MDSPYSQLIVSPSNLLLASMPANALTDILFQAAFLLSIGLALILAICPTTLPTAPAAPLTSTVSPDFNGPPRSSRPMYAVALNVENGYITKVKERDILTAANKLNANMYANCIPFQHVGTRSESRLGTRRSCF